MPSITSPREIYEEYIELWNSLGLNPHSEDHNERLFLSSYDVKLPSSLTFSWFREVLGHVTIHRLNRYGHVMGPSEFRRTVCEYERARNRTVQVETSNIVITASSTAAVFASILHLKRCGRGNAIGIITPTYYVFEEAARILGFDVYFIDQNCIAEQLTEFRTISFSAIIVTNPTFPEGIFLKTSQLNLLIEFSKRRDTTLIIDEAYSNIPLHPVYPPYSPPSGENIIRLNSFSKLWGLSGLRGGYIAAASNIAKSIAAEAEIMYARSNALTSHVYNKMLLYHVRMLHGEDSTDDLYHKYANDWHRFMDHLRKSLKKLTEIAAEYRFAVAKTRSGFNTVLLLNTGKITNENWKTFVAAVAKKHKVLLHLGNILSGASETHLSHVRVTLGLTKDEIEKGLRAVNLVLQEM